MPAEKVMIEYDERLVRWSLPQKCEEWVTPSSSPILASLRSNWRSTNPPAAKLLDISRDALRHKLNKFGLIGGDEEGAQTAVVEE
jgi:hypothetical protein